MTKRSGHPELFILLWIGIKPQKLIDRGYSRATVYKYSAQMGEIRKKINEFL